MVNQVTRLFPQATLKDPATPNLAQATLNLVQATLLSRHLTLHRASQAISPQMMVAPV